VSRVDRRRIVVIFHEQQNTAFVESHYAVCHLARFWRESGHDVVYAFGAARMVPADLAILHVDLSVVPDAYLRLAERYPVAINGGVADIRKSAISANLLRRGDAYSGRVIVKSDLNFAGLPERFAAGTAGRVVSRVRRLIARRRGARAGIPHFETPSDYRIYDRLADVPDACFAPGIAVEKFVPEMDGAHYCLRIFQFLGDRTSCVRITAADPIVKTDHKLSREPIDPHPAIVALRASLRFDFGKFDYVERDGEAILLDANKTPGHGPTLDTYAEQRLRRQAAGLDAYFA
jgi:hypothetical protein